MKIRIEALSKLYGGVTALDAVTLEVEPGQIVAVLGMNGAGKTTLLRCLAGISAPSHGRIYCDGEQFLRTRVDLRRRLSFLPDFPPMFHHMTVGRHIAMALRLYDADNDGAEARVVELLRKFDLLTFVETPVGNLSRGQAYKTALTALLALDPDLWLLDEPFASGMDPVGINVFRSHAREAAQHGHTVIYSTQLLDLAERFSDLVVILYRGELRAFGSIAELRQETKGAGNVLEDVFEKLRDQEL